MPRPRSPNGHTTGSIARLRTAGSTRLAMSSGGPGRAGDRGELPHEALLVHHHVARSAALRPNCHDRRAGWQRGAGRHGHRHQNHGAASVAALGAPRRVAERRGRVLGSSRRHAVSVQGGPGALHGHLSGALGIAPARVPPGEQVLEHAPQPRRQLGVARQAADLPEDGAKLRVLRPHGVVAGRPEDRQQPRQGLQALRHRGPLQQAVDGGEHLPGGVQVPDGQLREEVDAPESHLLLQDALLVRALLILASQSLLHDPQRIALLPEVPVKEFPAAAKHGLLECETALSEVHDQPVAEVGTLAREMHAAASQRCLFQQRLRQRVDACQAAAAALHELRVEGVGPLGHELPQGGRHPLLHLVVARRGRRLRRRLAAPLRAEVALGRPSALVRAALAPRLDHGGLGLLLHPRPGVVVGWRRRGAWLRARGGLGAILGAPGPELVVTVREAAELAVRALASCVPHADARLVVAVGRTKLLLAVGEVALGVIAPSVREGLAEAGFPEVRRLLQLRAGVRKVAIRAVLAEAALREGVADAGFQHLPVRRPLRGVPRPLLLRGGGLLATGLARRSG
mmetsp:Transcript_66570/g.195301  ORF Transcript_66570/g.195301 Transcript_66570/m.195301 type:complete len:570 (+) Transcript_66570:60-1769(+)